MGSVPIVPNSSVRNVYIGERVLVVDDLTKVSLLYCYDDFTSNRVLR